MAIPIYRTSCVPDTAHPDPHEADDLKVNELPVPAGGGTFLFREESTQRTALGEAVSC